MLCVASGGSGKRVTGAGDPGFVIPYAVGQSTLGSIGVPGGTDQVAMKDELDPGGGLPTHPLDSAAGAVMAEAVGADAAELWN